VEKFPHFQGGPLLNLSLFLCVCAFLCCVRVRVRKDSNTLHDAFTHPTRFVLRVVNGVEMRSIFVVCVVSPLFFFLLFFTFFCIYVRSKGRYLARESSNSAPQLSNSKAE
jgi:hypothetical protein